MAEAAGDAAAADAEANLKQQEKFRNIQLDDTLKYFSTEGDVKRLNVAIQETLNNDLEKIVKTINGIDDAVMDDAAKATARTNAVAQFLSAPRRPTGKSLNITEVADVNENATIAHFNLDINRNAGIRTVAAMFGGANGVFETRLRHD